MVEAEKSGIRIVESPFVISFKDITKFFKPGLPFDFAVRTIYLPNLDVMSIELNATTGSHVKELQREISPNCPGPCEPP